MQAALSRSLARSCRSPGNRVLSAPVGRAWRCAAVASNADTPFASHFQESAGQEDDDAAFSGTGPSPSNLPRIVFQDDRTCPLRFAKHVAFFKRMGIHAEGFRKIVSMYPQVLNLDPDTELKASITLLQSALGNTLVAEGIVSWPDLLGVGFPPTAVGLGRESVQEKSSLQVSGTPSRALGCPRQAAFSSGDSSGHLSKELYSLQPASSMQELSLPQQIFASKIDILLKCGFKKDTRLLAKALHCSLHISKQDIDAVVHALMSIGLSRNNAGRLIKLQPTILQQKPSEITSKLDYILNTLGLSFEDLFKYSSFILYNLDSHIRPRFLMHGWLKSKRLLRRNFKLDYIMSMSEKHFILKFVECHEDGMNMFRGFRRNAK